jgi:hypothetical protein
MKALFTSAVIISLVAVIYPAVGLADYSLQTVGQNQDALVFQIQNSSLQNTPGSLTMQNIVQSDPLVTLLTQYLNSYGSPLSPYASQIVQLPNWKKDLAISYVESHMGVYCFNNNCSGMGGAPGTSTWREYPTKMAWLVDLDNLMSEPLYSQQYNTCQKMKGVYVQPGSASWVYGCEKVYSELTNLEEQASAQQLANSVNSTAPLALATAN